MRTVDVAERIKGAKQLPALSASNQKVLKMLGSSNASVHELAAALAQSPQLTACILKLANSAAYGGVETTKLPQAIMRVGLNMLRTLVLSNSVLQRVSSVGQVSELDRKGYWRYCLGVGIAARAVAYRGRMEIADDAFLAGLIHGIGVTVLDVFYPDELRIAIATVKTKQDTLSSAIKSATELTLGEIGAALVEEWQLGQRVGKAVALMDKPGIQDSDENVGKLVDCLFAGIALTRAANIGKPLDGRAPLAGGVAPGWSLMDKRIELALANCGLTPEVFAKRTEDLKSDFAVFESLA